MKEKYFKSYSLKILFNITAISLSCIAVYFYIDLFFFYKPIEYKKEYSGIVKSKVISRANSLIFLNEEKLFILDSRHKKYSPPDLDTFIAKGDSLIKSANSDTLYIYRNNKQYSYIISF